MVYVKFQKLSKVQSNNDCKMISVVSCEYAYTISLSPSWLTMVRFKRKPYMVTVQMYMPTTDYKDEKVDEV